MANGAVGILIPPGYETSFDANGILRRCSSYSAIHGRLTSLLVCASCYRFFQLHFVGLSPPIQVLNYILHYLNDIPEAEQLSLYEVDINSTVTIKAKVTNISLAMVPVRCSTCSDSQRPESPYRSQTLPYLGLYTLVTLMPSYVAGQDIPTQHLPPPSILRHGRFEAVPYRTRFQSGNKDAARIFDILAVTDDTPISSGTIPLAETSRRWQWLRRTSCEEGPKKEKPWEKPAQKRRVGILRSPPRELGRCLLVLPPHRNRECAHAEPMRRLCTNIDVDAMQV